MRRKDKISELEFKIDFMNAWLLCTLPERQEQGKEQVRNYLEEYYELTGTRYLSFIQREKYRVGEE